MPTPSDPTAGPTGQSSSKMSGDPIELLNSTKECIQRHADLNEVYGLCQPAATLGSHPWLRDSLADPSELEPGNAAPSIDQKMPFKDYDDK